LRDKTNKEDVLMVLEYANGNFTKLKEICRRSNLTMVIQFSLNNFVIGGHNVIEVINSGMGHT
jgi:hypothetical protein